VHRVTLRWVATLIVTWLLSWGSIMLYPHLSTSAVNGSVLFVVALVGLVGWVASGVVVSSHALGWVCSAVQRRSSRPR
jgi:hypothetical protein